MQWEHWSLQSCVERSSSVWQAWRLPASAAWHCVPAPKCRPRTGRTHQIRVHLQYLGYPIANDTQYGGTYGGPLASRTMAQQLGISWDAARQQLGAEGQGQPGQPEAQGCQLQQQQQQRGQLGAQQAEAQQQQQQTGQGGCSCQEPTAAAAVERQEPCSPAGSARPEGGSSKSAGGEQRGAAQAAPGAVGAAGSSDTYAQSAAFRSSPDYEVGQREWATGSPVAHCWPVAGSTCLQGSTLATSTA